MTLGRSLHPSPALPLTCAFLAACVSHSAPATASLDEYALPEKPFSAPETFTASTSNQYRRMFALAKQNGLHLCWNAKSLSRSLAPYLPNMSELERVTGWCPAGEFEAVFIDDLHQQGGAPGLLRSGKVQGRMRSHDGTELSGSGEFRLERTVACGQLTFSLSSSLVAGMQATFSRVRDTPELGFLAFKTQRGLVGALIGVQQLDTIIHLPVRVNTGGVLSVQMKKEEVPLTVNYAASLFQGPAFPRERTTTALIESTPFAVRGYSRSIPIPPPNPSEAFRLLPTLQAALLAVPYEQLPQQKLICDSSFLREDYLRTHVIGVSESQVYFVPAIEDALLDDTTAVFRSWTTVQRASKGLNLPAICSLSTVEFARRSLGEK